MPTIPTRVHPVPLPSIAAIVAAQTHAAVGHAKSRTTSLNEIKGGRPVTRSAATSSVVDATTAPANSATAAPAVPIASIIGIAPTTATALPTPNARATGPASPRPHITWPTLA